MTEAEVQAPPVVPADDDEIPLASAEMFEQKKAREEYQVTDFGGRKAKVLHRAIGRKEYDVLLTSCPPSTKQRADGATYNQDKFAPILLSRVVVIPQMSEAQWRNIWNDDNWNRVELGDIFFKAVEVCSSSAPLDPTEPD